MKAINLAILLLSCLVAETVQYPPGYFGGYGFGGYPIGGGYGQGFYSGSPLALPYGPIGTGYGPGLNPYGFNPVNQNGFGYGQGQNGGGWPGEPDSYGLKENRDRLNEVDKKELGRQYAAAVADGIA